jgi:hypothetical protein
MLFVDVQIGILVSILLFINDVLIVDVILGEYGLPILCWRQKVYRVELNGKVLVNFRTESGRVIL